ncbi:CpsD/CapB family tyrosine-protein kinase [Paenibacillus sp. CN-4]|uniref:CpsD/CapB family tyrosine-protein kinase n=1 Tax=Paenibacillus nanchangensis TaxID=3348343 RepID=UPI003979D5B8
MLRLNNSLVADANPASRVSESFRSLRTYIRQLGILEPGAGKVLLFTSAGDGEGKTTILSNLAVSFVQDGKKVAVVDCNLRKPALHLVFGTEEGGGLTGYLKGQAEADETPVYGSLANLAVIPAGETVLSPADLLGGERMQVLLNELRASFDLVLLDTPPAVEFSDARVLAPQSDGVIVVARHGKTKRESLRKLKLLLDQAGTPILGIAMNQTK